jgi:hypothetical protein
MDLDKAIPVVAQAMRDSVRAPWGAWVRVLNELDCLDQVRALHRPVPRVGAEHLRVCGDDGQSWPCRTDVALGDTPAPTEDEEDTAARTCHCCHADRDRCGYPDWICCPDCSHNRSK